MRHSTLVLKVLAVSTALASLSLVSGCYHRRHDVVYVEHERGHGEEHRREERHEYRR